MQRPTRAAPRRRERGVAAIAAASPEATPREPHGIGHCVMEVAAVLVTVAIMLFCLYLRICG